MGRSIEERLRLAVTQSEEQSKKKKASKKARKEEEQEEIKSETSRFLIRRLGADEELRGSCIKAHGGALDVRAARRVPNVNLKGCYVGP